MALHIAASGAKVGQWVKCTAKPGNCQNAKNGGSGKHIEQRELYAAKEWMEEAVNHPVFLKNITENDINRYDSLPLEDRKIYEQMSVDRQKRERKAREEKARKEAEEKQQIRRIANGMARPNTSAPRRNVSTSGLTRPLTTKKLHYTDSHGVPQSIEVKTYAYPAEDKRVLDKFYDKTTNAFLFNNNEKRIEEMVHYYVTHKETINKYHSENFVHDSFKVIQKTRHASLTPQYDAWKNFNEDVKLGVVPGSHYALHRTRQQAQDTVKGKKKVIPSVVHGFQEQVAKRVTDEGIALPDVKVTENMRTEENYTPPANKIGDAIGSLLYRFRRKNKD